MSKLLYNVDLLSNTEDSFSFHFFPYKVWLPSPFVTRDAQKFLQLLQHVICGHFFVVNYLLSWTCLYKQNNLRRMRLLLLHLQIYLTWLWPFIWSVQSKAIIIAFLLDGLIVPAGKFNEMSSLSCFPVKLSFCDRWNICCLLGHTGQLYLLFLEVKSI